MKQATVPDVGIFAHQILVTPSNTAAILVTRGNDPAGGKPEDPGALKVFTFKDGQLTNRASVAPAGGYGFGPRHLDFHPSGQWVYVSLERQNKLHVYKLQDDTLEMQPLFSKDTLAEPGNIRPRQFAGTIHVHPNGRYVYVANRSDAMTDFQGKQVYLGGENNIAVFGLSRRREQHRGVRHRPGHRRADADPEYGRARLPPENLRTRPERTHDGCREHHTALGARWRAGANAAGDSCRLSRR